MENFKTPIKRNNRLREVIIPPSPLMKQIGYGTGVAVYEMRRSPVLNKLQSPWAVKKLTSKNKTNNHLNTRLRQEAETLRKLTHPNIVGFRAFTMDKEGRNILAMEECTTSLGELIETRQENDIGPFPAKTIEKVLEDVVKALNYLHNDAFLLHGDIKSYNVLIQGDFEICKVCDFGVCLPLDKTGRLDREKAGEDAEYIGTRAWCGPEILSFPEVITDKADIFALGLTLWEMIALIPPLEEEMMNKLLEINENLLDSVNILSNDKENTSKTRTRPMLPDVELDQEYNWILEIFYVCTHEDYTKRPSSADLKMICEEIRKEKMLH